MTRRTLLRLGAAAATGMLSGGAGLMLSTAARAATTPKPGAHIRVASLVPAAAVDPVRLTDSASILLVNQTGEYLLNDDPHRGLVPVLAESWRHNADASVWEFTIRRNVKFHDGQILGARDVVATFERLVDPASASAALSAFRGVLSKGNIKALDDHTVQFRLDAPNGNFPYYVSSDTYNGVILPANYSGHYEKTFIGTGPFRLDQYTSGGARFVRNTAYWGPQALPERVEFSFFADEAAIGLALLGQQTDLVVGISAQQSRLLASNPAITITRLPSTQHDQVHMRTDQGPFKDKRVRQALALTLDRPKLVEGLLHGYGQVGNDHPFAAVYPSADRAVAQRTQDLKTARALLAQAGFANGFSTTLVTEKLGDIPQFAVVLQNAARAVGIDIRLKVEDQSLYYGDAQFGHSDWLDSTLGITDYGHRGTPNLVLSAPLLSGGAWNAAHFRNPAYDALVKQYVSTVDLNAQRTTAGKIEQLLLDETPLIISAYRDAITACAANLSGVQAAAIPQLQLANAWFS
ncbi:peptide/nickel transport system substrate-binding protein [Paraburkholderia eburnea]|uniref:Peptide/nickel transport system substrate-binding protein n=1 Tax=Paraburkholderia eburnea TaxID=1189126 RepID=A0A2S4M9W5_9BURK|nr:ABC transporter substrate-binding protein [Paraburkholderia eburnea]POR51528.1 peptide/nickel transport system substrate-binding protein [Paraburkholderia eburnea]PRZ22559.1 peptide/nickel transport system substrate-binding protein [Paraburkholderia eburnea]